MPVGVLMHSHGSGRTVRAATGHGGRLRGTRRNSPWYPRPSRAQEQESTVEYTRLGLSGLKVSRIALGCMSFGDTSRGFNEWALDDEAAEPIFRQAMDLGDHVLGHRERIRLRHLGGDRRASRQEVQPAGRRRLGNEGLLPDAPRARRVGAVAQGDPGADRRIPDPAGHRLRRPLPDPPLRRGHAGRGDDGGAPRRGQGRQGAVTWGPRPCGPGSSQRCSTSRTCTGGRGSSPCRTSTA